MAITQAQQKHRVTEFIKKWIGRGNEKQDTQEFWRGILQIFDVMELDAIKFEVPTMLENKSYIDGLIESTGVLIEQKSITVDLDKKEKQSDGAMLSPYRQALRYTEGLSKSKQPRWIVVSNFKEIRIYDRDDDIKKYTSIMLEDLKDNIECLRPLVDVQSVVIRKEMEISKQAGEIVGLLYDEMKGRYKNTPPEEAAKYLNKLCVRLVFCLYAEDTDIFGKHLMFHDYLAGSNPDSLRQKLVELFCILNTEESKRNPYLDDALLAFPYVNGGLFEDTREDIERQIPRLTERFCELLLDNASVGFDWSGISPTIFGAMFESTLNPDTRRSGGMHYTSIENIHKVIDPLFLDDLKAEMQNIMAYKNPTTRRNTLEKFRDKLASLTFLDPACGSGNFLTLTYTELRKLENTALQQIIADTKGVTGGQKLLSSDSGLNAIKVSIQQFYGIEINDFAVSVAKTALWIAESQMMEETKQIVDNVPDFLPLSNLQNIREDNALRIDWNDVVDKNNLSYIISNPPFVGSKRKSDAQKEDVKLILSDLDGAGNLDYVSCWYKKASDMMTDTEIKTALVSTNSITQGEQVALLWRYLFNQGVHIDYAYKTFNWDSEATLKAHVHCVIVGFSKTEQVGKKLIYCSDGNIIEARNINGYLMNSVDVFLERRKLPLCDVPEIIMGPMSLSNNHLILTKAERDEIIRIEPQSEKWIRKFSMGREFIDGTMRYCLWLKDISPKELKASPMIMKHVKACQQWREQQTKTGDAYKFKDTPHLFRPSIKFDDTQSYLAIPQTSSGNRDYIPIAFVDDDMIPGQKLYIISNASKYQFAVLMSVVHMAWTRVYSGRMKSDYSYSIYIVYNNFPWCNPTPEQKAKIEKTAQAILDARALYPECSLADLYDDLTMPTELRKAHQENDKAVMEAYGFDTKWDESKIVSELMLMYKALTEKETSN